MCTCQKYLYIFSLDISLAGVMYLLQWRFTHMANIMVASPFYNTYYGINTNCYNLCNVQLPVVYYFIEGVEGATLNVPDIAHKCYSLANIF